MRDLWGLPPDHDPALSDEDFIRYLRLMDDGQPGAESSFEQAGPSEPEDRHTKAGRSNGPSGPRAGSDATLGTRRQSRRNEYVARASSSDRSPDARSRTQRPDAPHRRPVEGRVERLRTRTSQLDAWMPSTTHRLWPMLAIAMSAVCVVAGVSFWAGQRRSADSSLAADGLQPVAQAGQGLPTTQATGDQPLSSSTAVAVEPGQAKLTAAPSSGSTAAMVSPPAILIGDRIRAWFDAADQDTLLASSDCRGAVATTTVGCWLDRANSGRAIQTVTSRQPQLTSTADGARVPFFNGKDSALSFDPVSLPVGNFASTTFVVAQLSSTAPPIGWQIAFSYGGDGAGQTRTVGKLDTGAEPFADAKYNGRALAPTGQWSTTRATLVDTEMASGYIRMAVDGSSMGEKAKVAFDTVNTWGTIGGNASSAGGSYWAGSIQEIVVLAGTVSPHERAEIEDYLAEKWNIPLS